MFEVGKLSDESLDSFLVELEKVIYYVYDQMLFQHLCKGLVDPWIFYRTALIVLSSNAVL